MAFKILWVLIILAHPCGALFSNYDFKLSAALVKAFKAADSYFPPADLTTWPPNALRIIDSNL